MKVFVSIISFVLPQYALLRGHQFLPAQFLPNMEYMISFLCHMIVRANQTQTLPQIVFRSSRAKPVIQSYWPIWGTELVYQVNGTWVTPGRAQCGFEEWYPMPFGQCSYRDVPLVKDGDHTCVKNTYATDLFTDNALKFLGEQVEEEAPFCLNVCYTAPHKPWGREHHPEELWDDYYDNCPFKSTPGPEEPLASGFQRYSFLSPSDAEARKKVNPSELRRQDLAGYFASIEAMDSNIGRLLSWLDSQDLRSNT